MIEVKELPFKQTKIQKYVKRIYDNLNLQMRLVKWQNLTFEISSNKISLKLELSKEASKH